VNIFREISFLHGNTKGAIFLIGFRTASYFSQTKILRVIGFPLRVAYRLLFQWILGIDIPEGTKIGAGVNIFHGHGLVVHSATLIGEYVTLRQNTTIGTAKPNGGSPILGNHVDVGANVVIIGDIMIGNNAVIAAGSVVIHSIPEDVVVAGNPAKIVRYLVK
jgi:serine acetyltransferase